MNIIWYWLALIVPWQLNPGSFYGSDWNRQDSPLWLGFDCNSKVKDGELWSLYLSDIIIDSSHYPDDSSEIKCVDVVILELFVNVWFLIGSDVTGVNEELRLLPECVGALSSSLWPWHVSCSLDAEKHRRPSHHAFQQAGGEKRATVISALLFSKGCSSHIHPSIHPPPQLLLPPTSSPHSLREERERGGGD